MLKVYSILLRIISFIGVVYGVYLMVILDPLAFIRNLPVRIEIYQVMRLPYLLLQDIYPFAAASFLILGGVICGAGSTLKICKIVVVVILVSMISLSVLASVCIGFNGMYVIILFVPVTQLVCVHKKKSLMDALAVDALCSTCM